jgi:predicted house-cleaning noncanonical NTP pyrophosphatase (MazG superfamily)
MAKKTKYLTKKEVEELIEQKNGELFKCFNKLVKDLDIVKKSNDRIVRILLGDEDYRDKGLMERLEPVVEHYEHYQRAGVWDILLEMFDKYKAIKWLSILITTGGLVSATSIIWEIIKILGK